MRKTRTQDDYLVQIKTEDNDKKGEKKEGQLRGLKNATVGILFVTHGPCLWLC